MERDEAWQRVFERMPVEETLARDGIFRVSADQLKAFGGREPRLMAKIDTLAERPAILAEKGLALFPVRNGHYALFPDPEQKSFFRFAGEVTPPVRRFVPDLDLGGYDTFPRGQEASESQALDFAFHSGLSPAFCGDAGMRLTLRGRLFSGNFAFPTPVGALAVDVARVQIEVDAGYEGAEAVFLMEAKRGRREDFHIRQLWYPYLHWSRLTGKRVIPIFFAYSNAQYFLTEFAFGPGFGEIKVVRNRAYCLEEPQAEVDFPALFAATQAGAEPEGAFPQANDLDKIVDLVQAAGSAPLTKAALAEAFGFEERQGDYYGNAACYLGLVDREDSAFAITAAGKAFNGLRSRAERTRALLARMLAIPSLREALHLLMEREFRAEKIAAGELAALIRERTGLGASTPARRASTLRAWLAWIMGNVRIRPR
jgi:hypothetical protein